MNCDTTSTFALKWNVNILSRVTGKLRVFCLLWRKAPAIKRKPSPALILWADQATKCKLLSNLRDGHDTAPHVAESAVEGDLEHRLLCQPAHRKWPLIYSVLTWNVPTAAKTLPTLSSVDLKYFARCVPGQIAHYLFGHLYSLLRSIAVGKRANCTRAHNNLTWYKIN